MGLPTKDELIDKLFSFPLLRLLFYERWFRLAFVGFLLVLLCPALLLPKIWRTSRPDFLPVIKVSGLDLLQAWSLKRSALKSMAAGKFSDAHFAWQSALANNSADPELVRGALENNLKITGRREMAPRAIQQSFWLLRLTDTNLVDTELVTRVFEHYKFYDGVINLLESKTDPFPVSLEMAYLRALFNRGRLQAFDARWSKAGEQLRQDPELGLYRAAYLVGWGPPGMITEARQRLEAATEDPNLRILAYRLNLVLSAHQMDPNAYSVALKKLEDWREDTLSYHVGYWRLLAMSGQKAKAVSLAQAYPHSPASPQEVIELAQVCSELGQRDLALQLFKRHASVFGNSASYWIAYANHLLEARQWEELRNLALEILSHEGLRDELAGFTYFLEGRAELALGREENARAAFQKAAERDSVYPHLSRQVATQLLQLGYPALARDVLANVENAFANQASYWHLLFAVADQLKDVDLMLKAGARAYALGPRDPVAINNYAAALILKREKPEEAIKLTLELYAQSPDSLYAIVNHSAALLLSGRPKEAETLLGRVNTNSLNRVQLALYNLDLFETYFSLQRYDVARAVRARIDPNLLYPSQQKHLEAMDRQMPPRPKS